MLFVATSQFFTPIDGCVVSECDCKLLGRGVLKLDTDCFGRQHSSEFCPEFRFLVPNPHPAPTPESSPTAKFKHEP